MTAKQIEKMQYGSSEQNKAADIWYSRFVAFSETHEISTDCVWDRIHLNDVWYRARQRWMSNQ